MEDETTPAKAGLVARVERLALEASKIRHIPILSRAVAYEKALQEALELMGEIAAAVEGRADA